MAGAQEAILHLATHDKKATIGHIQLLTDLLQRQVDAATFATGEAANTMRYLALIRQACATAYKRL